MSYKFTTGSVSRGDIYFEDDTQGDLTYIDFGYDTITLRPSGTAQLYVEDGKVGIGTTTPANTLHAYADTSDYVALIDNDGTSTAHGMKITSDGTGTGTYLLDIEAASTTLFRFRADGRLGIGTTTPGQTLTVDGDIGIGTDLIHKGDSDTLIRFQNDDVTIKAGNVNFINFASASQTKLTINDSRDDLDFIVRSPNESLAVYLNAGNEVFHINHGESNFKTKIHSLNGEAITVNDDGVILNEDGAAANDFRVESDSNTHMFFVDAGSETVGIGTSSPDRKLDVLDAADPQLRLTHTDGSKYVDFQTTAAGDLHITGSADNAHLRFISPENATIVVQSQNSGDSDASLAFSVDAGGTVPFSLGVDDSDSDKFKIGGEIIDLDTKMTITTGGDVGIGWTDPGSRLNISGSVQFNITSFSANATLTSTHHVVVVDCGTASRTITLPAASNAIAGRQYIIKRADTGNDFSNDLTIAADGSDTIDGSGSDLTNNGHGTSHTLICAGTGAWIIVDKYVAI